MRGATRSQSSSKQNAVDIRGKNDGKSFADGGCRLYPRREMSPEDWQLIFERLRQRIESAKLHAVAVCSDSQATLEQIRRARVARRGVAYTTEVVENFVPARRSTHLH